MRVNETRTISLVRISPRFGSMQQWLPGRILRVILLLLLPVSAHAQTRTACLIVDELTKVEMVLHRVIDREPVGQQDIDKTRQIFEQTELKIAQVEGRDDIEAYVFRFAEDYIADRRRIFDLFEILSSSQIRARATSVGARLISNRLTAMQSGQGCASDGNSFDLADDDDQQDADDPAIQSNAADTQSTLLSLPSTAPRQSRGVIQRVYASYMNIHRDIRMLIFSCLVGSMMSLALYSGVRINRRRERRAKRYRCAVDIKIGYQEEEEEASTMVEISQTGAKIQMHADLEPGTNISISWRDEDLTGKIVWSNQNFAGVKFAHPLRQRELKDLRAAFAA